MRTKLPGFSGPFSKKAAVRVDSGGSAATQLNAIPVVEDLLSEVKTEQPSGQLDVLLDEHNKKGGYVFIIQKHHQYMLLCNQRCLQTKLQ